MLNNNRIIIVLPGFKLGGAERQALLLARHLRHEQKAQVEVWGLTYPGQATELCDSYGLPWRIIPMTWSYDRMMRFKAWTKFTWAMRQARPDIILPYTIRPNVICGQVWRLTGAQLCLWNQRDEGRSNRVGRRFQRWAARQTPLFVSNSGHGQEFLVQTLGVPPDKISVIYNGVELAAPEANRIAWRKRLEIKDNCLLVAMVANLHGFKDHATLLRAWRQVVDRLEEVGRSAVLLLAGRFEDTTELLQSLARDLALGESVRFLGWMDDIAGLLGAIDLGVFSSHYEGCPNGLLECMAAGLAVAATDVEGIREAVGPEGYEWLAPPGDAGTLAQRIVKLALNPELRSRLGNINRRRIETEFSPQRMSEQTVALIEHGLQRQ
jgi:glycosyltransferase involved in cell wall biosynthesis